MMKEIDLIIYYIVQQFILCAFSLTYKSNYFIKEK